MSNKKSQEVPILNNPAWLPAEPEQTGLRGRFPGDVVYPVPFGVPSPSLLPGWVILPSGTKLNLATVRRIIRCTGVNNVVGLQLMFSDSLSTSMWGDDAEALDGFINESAEWDLRKEEAKPDPPTVTKADIDRMKRDGYLGAGWAK